MYWQSFVFTGEIILPVFLLVVLGIFLRQRRVIDDHFVTVSSRLVFTLTLPVLVFLAIAKVRFDSGVHIELIVFVALAILSSCLFSFVWARFAGIDEDDVSAFV
ncbi:hypothetical protein Q4595_16895, partial [Wenyingzhuangia sp. 1_MG-2023]|nr:hypothetical protein [Wenyingzhuangia sp. 1_MG-2023]